MSASKLLDALNRQGASLEMVDGQPRIRGAQISDDLLAKLRANRVAVLAEFEKRHNSGEDRYRMVPPADAPMLAMKTTAPDESKQAIMEYVLRQPRTVHAWVMTRSNDYFERGGIGAEDCDWRACVDVIAWQRRTTAEGAITFICDDDPAH